MGFIGCVNLKYVLQIYISKVDNNLINCNKIKLEYLYFNTQSEHRNLVQKPNTNKLQGLPEELYDVSGAGCQAEGCRTDPQQSLPSLPLSHSTHATLLLMSPTMCTRASQSSTEEPVTFQLQL